MLFFKQCCDETLFLRQQASYIVKINFAYDCYRAVFAASGVQTDFFFSMGSSHDQIQGEIDYRMRLTTSADACVPRRLISHLLNQDLAARCIRLDVGIARTRLK